jgi:predicted transcriptional regulator
MGRKANLALRQQIWSMYINDKNETRIAKKLGISQQYVSYHVRKVKKSNEYRDNMRQVVEFSELRMQIIDAITQDISELTEKIEKIADDPKMIVVWKMLHDARNSRRIDLYRVQGDGETVLALRQKMKSNEIISNGITQGS